MAKISTITYTYSYNFDECTEAGDQVDIRNAVDTEEIYRLCGAVPPRLTHTLHVKEGSSFGETDHVILRWEGYTLEGIVATAVDAVIPRGCVVEIQYTASSEFGGPTHNFFTPDGQGRYNSISVPSIMNAVAVFGDNGGLIPLELAASYYTRVYLGTSTERIGFNGIPDVSPDYRFESHQATKGSWADLLDCVGIELNDQYEAVMNEIEEENEIRFIAHKDIPTNLLLLLDRRVPKDLYSSLRWSFQMH